jgi:hypothetical protein
MRASEPPICEARENNESVSPEPFVDDVLAAKFLSLTPRRIENMAGRAKSQRTPSGSASGRHGGFDCPKSLVVHPIGLTPGEKRSTIRQWALAKDLRPAGRSSELLVIGAAPSGSCA